MNNYTYKPFNIKEYMSYLSKKKVGYTKNSYPKLIKLSLGEWYAKQGLTEFEKRELFLIDSNRINNYV